MSLKALRALITFGPPATPGLPVKIDKLIANALDAAYGNSAGAKPDLKRAYKKLLRHLDLLDAFPDLPIPLPIDNSIWAKGIKNQLPGYDGPLGTAQ